MIARPGAASTVFYDPVYELQLDAALFHAQGFSLRSLRAGTGRAFDFLQGMSSVGDGSAGAQGRGDQHHFVNS